MPPRAPNTKTQAAESVLLMRVVVVAPPAGVTFAMQRGQSELLAPVVTEDGSLQFDFTVRVVAPGASGSSNFLGEFTQGPRADRFLYVNSGVRAAQRNSCWDRRAKLKFAFLPSELLARALTINTCIEVRFHGTGADGGPTCGTVPERRMSWRLIDSGD